MTDSKDKPFRVTLDMLEYVDCECGAVGKYRELAPNRFMCTACGEEFSTTPCPPDCPHHLLTNRER